MRFLLYGESWRGAMPYSVSMALESLGHEVISFDYTHYLYSRAVPSKIGIALDRVLYRLVSRIVNEALQNILCHQQFDVLLVFKGLHLWPDTVQIARERCRWVINWNWDDFFNPLHRSQYLAEAFQEYDLILTPRRHLIGEYLQHGARQVEYLEFCFDPAIHYPVSVSATERDFWGGEVVFVGSWSKRREAFLSALKDFKVRIWGSSWKHADRGFRQSANVRIGPGVAACENMSRAVNPSLIGLNILTVENRDQTNLRNFEIPACGGFQLCERTGAVLELFQEGKEVECYESVEELVDKCRYYCSHEKERNAIALAGHAKVLSGGHTYMDRMRGVISLLSEA